MKMIALKGQRDLDWIKTIFFVDGNSKLNRAVFLMSYCEYIMPVHHVIYLFLSIREYPTLVEFEVFTAVITKMDVFWV